MLRSLINNRWYFSKFETTYNFSNVSPYRYPCQQFYCALSVTHRSISCRLDITLLKKWNVSKTKSKELFGNIPIFARIDYGNVGSPLAVFSQELTKEQANQFLRIADEFLHQKGIIFIYTLHGGNMGKIGQKGKILSYGKYDWYDSLAPEFDTYETIKELARNKK